MEILKIKEWKRHQAEDVQFEISRIGRSAHSDEISDIIAVIRLKDRRPFELGTIVFDLKLSKTRWVDVTIETFYLNLKDIRLAILLFDIEEGDSNYPKESFTMEVEINALDDSLCDKLNNAIIDNFM